MTTQSLCGNCGKSCSLRCSRCATECFCDRACFKAAWKRHKKICIPTGKERDPEAFKAFDVAMDGIKTLEQGNIGGLTGSNMTNKIGSFLGLTETLAGKEMHDAQQTFMSTDRFPKLQAVAEGNFTLYTTRAGRKTAVEPLSEACSLLKDGAKCFVEHGRRGHRQTTDEFLFFHPGSLACELQAFCTGRVQEEEGLSPFKVIEGGPLYLIGETGIFWSCAVHFTGQGSCLPPNAPDVHVEETFFCRETDRMYNSAQGAQLSRSRPTQFSSTSLAFCQIGGSKDPHPILELEDGMLPSTVGQLPQWWKDIASHWDGAFARCGIPGSASSAAVFRPHCMFRSTPQGCVTTHVGRVCCAWHDPAYLESLEMLVSKLGDEGPRRRRAEMVEREAVRWGRLSKQLEDQKKERGAAGV